MSRHNIEDELQKGLELIHEAYNHKVSLTISIDLFHIIR